MLKSWRHVSVDRFNSRLCATGINNICAAGKNINPRFRIKINASTEGDVRRVTALAFEATEICLYTVFYMRYTGPFKERCYFLLRVK